MMALVRLSLLMKNTSGMFLNPYIYICIYKKCLAGSPGHTEQKSVSRFHGLSHPDCAFITMHETSAEPLHFNSNPNKHVQNEKI